MTQPDETSYSAPVDMPARRADDRHMDNRLALVEKHLAVVRADVASLRANAATKEDLATVKANLANLQANCATKEDLASVKADLANLQANCATRADVLLVKSELYIAMNAQTWKFVSWTTGLMGMLVAAVYFVARNVH